MMGDDLTTPTERELARVCIPLWGPIWRRPLAEKINVDERRVRRWRKEAEPVPSWVWKELARMVEDKQRQLADLYRLCQENEKATRAKEERARSGGQK